MSNFFFTAAARALLAIGLTLPMTGQAQSTTQVRFQTTMGNFVVELYPAKAPKTVAVLTSKFASVNFVTQGAREAMKKRGLTEAVYLEWEFGNRDFGAIASRVKEAKGVDLEPEVLLLGQRWHDVL